MQAALAPAIAAAVQAGAAAAGTAGGSSRGALDAEALAEALGSQLSLALQPVVAGLKVGEAGASRLWGAQMRLAGRAGRAAAAPAATQRSIAAAATLQEVTQALRSTEGQVVRAVQGCHATLLEVLQDSVALHREDQDRLYNAAAAAHNKAVFLMHRRVIFWNPSIARWHLLPLKNAHGELPPAGDSAAERSPCFQVYWPLLPPHRSTIRHSLVPQGCFPRRARRQRTC